MISGEWVFNSFITNSVPPRVCIDEGYLGRGFPFWNQILGNLSHVLLCAVPTANFFVYCLVGNKFRYICSRRSLYKKSFSRQTASSYLCAYIHCSKPQPSVISPILEIMEMKSLALLDVKSTKMCEKKSMKIYKKKSMKIYCKNTNTNTKHKLYLLTLGRMNCALLWHFLYLTDLAYIFHTTYYK